MLVIILLYILYLLNLVGVSVNCWLSAFILFLRIFCRLFIGFVNYLGYYVALHFIFV